MMSSFLSLQNLYSIHFTQFHQTKQCLISSPTLTNELFLYWLVHEGLENCPYLAVGRENFINDFSIKINSNR